MYRSNCLKATITSDMGQRRMAMCQCCVVYRVVYSFCSCMGLLDNLKPVVTSFIFTSYPGRVIARKLG